MREKLPEYMVPVLEQQYRRRAWVEIPLCDEEESEVCIMEVILVRGSTWNKIRLRTNISEKLCM